MFNWLYSTKRKLKKILALTPIYYSKFYKDNTLTKFAYFSEVYYRLSYFDLAVNSTVIAAANNLSPAECFYWPTDGRKFETSVLAHFQWPSAHKNVKKSLNLRKIIGVGNIHKLKRL